MPASSSNLDIRLAIIWQNILQRSHLEFFDGFVHAAIDRQHGHDKLSQPGYVGRSYHPGGLVVIGQNPGNGRDGLTPPDERQYQFLYELRDAKGSSERLKAYRSLMTTLETEVMTTWKIVRNVVEPLLGQLGLKFDEIAYLNLMKFRTISNSPPEMLYNRSWTHTVEQINALSPGLIVALGAGAYRKFKKRYRGKAEHDFVTRSIGDSGLPAQGQLDVVRIGKRFRGKLSSDLQMRYGFAREETHEFPT
jgi:hypothetical protein